MTTLHAHYTHTYTYLYLVPWWSSSLFFCISILSFVFKLGVAGSICSFHYVRGDLQPSKTLNKPLRIKKWKTEKEQEQNSPHTDRLHTVDQTWMDRSVLCTSSYRKPVKPTTGGSRRNFFFFWFRTWSIFWWVGFGCDWIPVHPSLTPPPERWSHRSIFIDEMWVVGPVPPPLEGCHPFKTGKTHPPTHTTFPCALQPQLITDPVQNKNLEFEMLIKIYFPTPMA